MSDPSPNLSDSAEKALQLYKSAFKKIIDEINDLRSIPGYINHQTNSFNEYFIIKNAPQDLERIFELREQTKQARRAAYAIVKDKNLTKQLINQAEKEVSLTKVGIVPELQERYTTATKQLFELYTDRNKPGFKAEISNTDKQYKTAFDISYNAIEQKKSGLYYDEGLLTKENPGALLKLKSAMDEIKAVESDIVQLQNLTNVDINLSDIKRSAAQSSFVVIKEIIDAEKQPVVTKPIETTAESKPQNADPDPITSKTPDHENKKNVKQETDKTGKQENIKQSVVIDGDGVKHYLDPGEKFVAKPRQADLDLSPENPSVIKISSSDILQHLENKDNLVDNYVRAPTWKNIHGWLKNEVAEGLQHSDITRGYIRKHCLVNGKNLNANTIQGYLDAIELSKIEHQGVKDEQLPTDLHGNVEKSSASTLSGVERERGITGSHRGNDGSLTGSRSDNSNGTSDRTTTTTNTIPRTGADHDADQATVSGRNDSTVTRQPGSPNSNSVNTDPAQNYVIKNELGQGSARQKALDNIEAIKTVKAISKGKTITQSDQEKLIKYVGWGATELAQHAFESNTKNPKWPEIQAELQAILTSKDSPITGEETYKAARRSTQYAHYTSKTVIDAIFKGAEKLGFSGGKIIDPGAGIGHFRGLVPEKFKVEYTGIERDTISGNIAKALYPNDNILIESYFDTKTRKDHYDLAVGNPPFSDMRVTADPQYRKHKFMLHDYFFAKTMDQLKPGGVMAFVTSKGTLDKTDDNLRQYLANQADFIGAIRLPNTAFKENSGTEVVTDILFLKKREPGQQPSGEPWLKTADMETQDGVTRVNEYYTKHPEMIMGETRLTGGLYRSDEMTVNPTGNLIEQLTAAIDKLPELSTAKAVTPEKTNNAPQLAESLSSHIADSKHIEFEGNIIKFSKQVEVPNGVMQTFLASGASTSVIDRFICTDNSNKPNKLYSELWSDRDVPGKINDLLDTLTELKYSPAKPTADSKKSVANDTKSELTETVTATQAQSMKVEFDATLRKAGSFFVTDTKNPHSGLSQLNEFGEAVPLSIRSKTNTTGIPKNKYEIIKDLVPVKEATLTVLKANLGSDDELKAAQAQLHAAYDQFYKKHGAINKSITSEKLNKAGETVDYVKMPNLSPFLSDPDAYRLSAIESYNEQENTAKKGAIFDRKILSVEAEPQIISAHDALAYTLNTDGKLDMSKVAALINEPVEVAVKELGDSIYLNPITRQYETQDEYLSGNVRQKLQVATIAAENDSSFNRNVSALSDVQPVDLTAKDIIIKLGAPWLNKKYIEQFASEVLQINCRVSHNPEMAYFGVESIGHKNNPFYGTRV